MKTTLLATVAILGLAAGGVALAERAQVNLPQLAAAGQPQPQTARHATPFAASGKPDVQTDARGTQLAGGWYPGATKEFAASGQPQPQTAEHATQFAASGKPEADTSRPSQV